MRPLTIITTYNRLELTKATLDSLAPDLPDLDLIIVDNGSTDGTAEWLSTWWEQYPRTNPWWEGEGNTRLILNQENLGCPRALNQALLVRKPGQPVVKLDNDIRILTPGWPVHVAELIDAWQEKLGRQIAMVSAYYTPWQQQRVVGEEQFRGAPVYHVQPIVGHAVWHTAEFMDRVGHFDVLAPEHIYGFEDLLLSHKATHLGWEMLAWRGWQIENIQRANALGHEQRDAHVEAMRPLYNERARRIGQTGTIYTRPDGKPDESAKGARA